VPDLDELGATLLPGAQRVGGPGGGPISWVRIMKARVPAFDALEPGDLAIVPAAALELVAPGPAELRAFVDSCLAARLSGLLLVEGEAAEGGGGGAGSEGSAGSSGGVRDGIRSVLDGLAAVLGDTALPALRLARTDPADLERSVIGFLVTRGAELDRQAGLLEARLELLALEGGGPAALVAAIATFLGRAVALEGRRGDALAVHAPADAPDSATAVTRYHARPRQAVALRVPLPATEASATGRAGASGTAAGSLALLGDRPVGELERISVARIAGLLALELSRDEAVRRARDQARRAEALPSGGPPWVVMLARQRTPGADDDAPIERERRDAIRRELRLLAPARRLALRGDADSLEIRVVLAVPGADDPDSEGLTTANRLSTFLGRTVAVSRPFSVAVDRPAAEAEARSTLESAESLPEPPDVARAARLPVYRLLGALHNLPDAERLSRALLEPLLAGRRDVRREHLATLRALLDHDGVSEAAAALGVHRNTVAYRARRIEELTGWRLSDPEIRLPLAVAIRLVQEA
jgi:purine catabolism regulator